MILGLGLSCLSWATQKYTGNFCFDSFGVFRFFVALGFVFGSRERTVPDVLLDRMSRHLAAGLGSTFV